MMKYLIIIFLLLPFLSFAQLKPKADNNGVFEMWNDRDCFSFALRTIADNNGLISDSCGAVLNKNEKTIYIVKAPYFKDMPNSYHGLTIQYINPDSNTKYWYKQQRDNKIHIYYFSKLFDYLEFYHFMIIPVMMQKKKVEYENRGYKVHFYFNQATAKYEYQRTECTTW